MEELEGDVGSISTPQSENFSLETSMKSTPTSKWTSHFLHNYKHMSCLSFKSKFDQT